MTDVDKMVEKLNKNAPDDGFYPEDFDFDQKIWYRDRCREAAPMLSELQQQNTDLVNAVTEGIALIKAECFGNALDILRDSIGDDS